MDFTKVHLLLSGELPSNATNLPYVYDTSQYKGRSGATALIVNSHPLIDFTTKKYGSSSVRFDASYYLWFDTNNLVFDTSDFCIQAWVNADAVQTGTLAEIFSTSGVSGGGTFEAGAMKLTFMANSVSVGKIQVSCFNFSSSQTTYILQANVDLRGAGWKHVALTRSGSAWTIWVDGVSQATGTFAGSVNTLVERAYVGGYSASTSNAKMYLDDLCISIGEPVYTSGFTPPGQLNSGISVPSFATNRFKQARAGALNAGPRLGALYLEARDLRYLKQGQFEYAGKKRLAGTAFDKGVPSNVAHPNANVWLLRQRDNVALTKTKSAADGTYSFDNIADGEYTVLAYDASRTFRAEAADFPILTDMP